MKIHHNIIAATILGFSIIIAVAIYSMKPMVGRYIYKEKTDDLSTESYVFDTATGTRYSFLIIQPSIATWNVRTLSDWKENAKKESKSK